MRSFQKILGFLSLLALVVNVQLGSGIFTIPSQIAPFGNLGILGWLSACSGAILLALGFGMLAQMLQDSQGGPADLVAPILGKQVSFMVSWSYWFVSWFSSLVVVITAAGGFRMVHPWIDHHVPSLFLEILCLVGVTLINLKSLEGSQKWNTFLVILKITPLIIIPCIGLFHIQPSYFVWPKLAHPVKDFFHLVSLLFWGFIGLEAGTNTSDKYTRKTLTWALVLGTLSAALVYIFNTTVLLGTLPAAEITSHSSVYGLFVERFLGRNWAFLINLMVGIVCLSSLSAWVLMVGQISYHGAHQGFFPPIFAKLNREKTPVWGIIIPNTLCCLFLVFFKNKSFAEKVDAFINSSVSLYLWIYLCSMIALGVGTYRQGISRKNVLPLGVGATGSIFCLFLIIHYGWQTFLISSAVPLSGLILRPLWRRKA